MTYTVIALTNDKAKLLAKKAVIHFDKEAAAVLADVWEGQGFLVTLYSEE